MTGAICPNCKHPRRYRWWTSTRSCSPEESRRFWNCKGYISQNVLAGCSLDIFFFYICPGREGPASDARVLETAERHGFPSLHGRVWLADAGYGLRRGILWDTVCVDMHGQRPRRRYSIIYTMHNYVMSLNASSVYSNSGSTFSTLRRSLKLQPRKAFLLFLQHYTTLSTTEQWRRE